MSAHKFQNIVNLIFETLKYCKFKPLQNVKVSAKKPGLQGHVKEPGVLVQVELASSQLSVLSTHSFISKKSK